MKKKVLFLMRDFSLGGSECFTISLVNGIDRARFDRVLGVLDQGGPLRDLVDPRVPVRSLGGRQGNALQFPWKAVQYARGLKVMLAAERPALVISDNWFMSILSCLAAGAIRRQGARLIIELHLPVRSFFFRSSFGNLLAPVKIRVSRTLFSRADAVVAVTRRISEEATRHLGIPTDKVKVIYNSVDVEQLRGLAQAAPAPDALAPYLVSVGRLEHEKGHDLLLQAFALVADRIPQRLVLVGEGSYRDELERMARNLGIGDRVEFTGALANPYGYIKQADCVVLPSRWESFSLVALEGLALEVPVIAAACDGPAEIMAGGYGVLVPVGDVQALAKAILELALDPALRARYRERALERAEAFSRSDMLRQYQELCDTMLNRSSLNG